MAIFIYKAKNSRGRSIQGVVEAANEEAVANLLSDKELSIIKIEKKDAVGLDRYRLSLFKKVKSKELVVFFRQFSVMIQANLPILKSMRILIKQTENKKLKDAIVGITSEIEGGSRLSDAMANYPDIFSNFFVNLIKSGETSGRLAEVMEYIAEQQEKDYELQSKIKGVMIYPVFILTGLIIVAFVVMTFVIPQITGILSDSGVTLPWTTKLLIGTSSVFQNWWWQIIVAAILLAVVFAAAIKSPRGKAVVDRLKLKIPVFGNIFKDIYVVRFTRSFHTLLKGGVPIAKALEVVKEVVGNRVFEDILADTIRQVDEGNSIVDSLVDKKEMPVMVAQMISVGEESGGLEGVLEELSKFYSREIDNYVRNLSSLIEPIIMVLLGVAVAIFVAAVIMPMWQLSASF